MADLANKHVVLVGRVLVFAVLLISWEEFPRLGLVNARLFPPFSEVLQHGIALMSNPQQVPNGFWTNLKVYLYEIFASTACSDTSIISSTT